MTFVLIAASAAATLASDDPVIPAAAVGLLRTAAEVVTRAGAIHDGVAGQAAAASAAAAASGYAQGHADGLAAAARATNATLFDYTIKLTRERASVRGDVAKLALEVVRRVAGELGPASVVAALAEQATLDLVPSGIATVRVASSAASAVREQLSRHGGLNVVGDAALAATDCRVETPLGVAHAGLEAQLAAIEAAWAAAAVPEPQHAG